MLFYGKNVESGKIIEQQVRNVDIFPTILDLIELKNSLKLDGVSLKPLMRDKIFEELHAYIESTPLIQIESNDVVGVRTEKYKYFRDSDDSQKRIHLYDLKADPNEDCNVYKNNPEIILEMEQILSSFTKRTECKYCNIL